MTVADYKKAAQELREFTYFMRVEKGKRLIARMKRFWDNGGSYFSVPEGTYVLLEPIPYADGGKVEGAGKVFLIAPHLGYFAKYPKPRIEPHPKSNWNKAGYIHNLKLEEDGQRT